MSHPRYKVPNRVVDASLWVFASALGFFRRFEWVVALSHRPVYSIVLVILRFDGLR